MSASATVRTMRERVLQVLSVAAREDVLLLDLVKLVGEVASTSRSGGVSARLTSAVVKVVTREVAADRIVYDPVLKTVELTPSGASFYRMWKPSSEFEPSKRTPTKKEVSHGLRRAPSIVTVLGLVWSCASVELWTANGSATLVCRMLPSFLPSPQAREHIHTMHNLENSAHLSNMRDNLEQTGARIEVAGHRLRKFGYKLDAEGNIVQLAVDDVV
ncbi:hypothetical protein C8T65DRAFT_699943 [Cerioporus squamosus]|nr:hypothetical protein C8T65DRAFT_699943 [Cerioporus squamosus]